MLKTHSQVAIQKMSVTVRFEYEESMEYIAGPHLSCGRVFFPLKLLIIFKIFQ